jgi:hypothetical protein
VVEPGPLSLKKLVMVLERRDAFHCWPLRDLLHLLKNLKQRFRNHELTLGPGRPRISGWEFSDACGGVPGLDTRGTSSSMSDALACEIMSPELCLTASELDEHEAARFLMPWSLLQMAIRAEGMSRDARLELLEVVFAQFTETFKRMPGTGRTKGGSEQACRVPDWHAPLLVDVPLTYNTRMQLISGMNFCVGLYWAISRLHTELALGRFSSHPCETHFGGLRTILRGHGKWAFWESAEAAISLIRRFVDDLGLAKRHADKRVPDAGARIPADDDADAIAPFVAADDEEGRFGLFTAARRFAVGDDVQLDGVLLEFLANRVEWAQVNRGLRSPAAPGAFGGIGCTQRVRISERPSARSSIDV